MEEIDTEDRLSVRNKLSKEAGFTGLSVLHRLHKLYGFDVLHDTVYDAMHNIPLNIASQHIHHYVEKELLCPRAEVEKRLKVFPWTTGLHACIFIIPIAIHNVALNPLTELKSGRLPHGINNRLGFWKAEDFQKFTFPASEFVLGGLLPVEEYHIWILVARLTELVYGHGSGRSGWTHEMLQLAKHLILRHNILTEEVQGLKSCHVTVHNLLHLLDDIKRFSSPDNYCAFLSKEQCTNTLKGQLTRRTLSKHLLLLKFVENLLNSTDHNKIQQQLWICIQGK